LDADRQRLIAFEGRAGLDPPSDRRELAFIEAGQTVRHAGERIVLSEGIELVDARTRRGAAQRYVERIGKQRRSRQRMIALEGKRAV
jgi:hypothetical protein